MGIADVLAGREGLAGIQRTLLDSPARDAVEALLRSLLATGVSADDFDLHRAKYKPNRHLTAFYDVALRDDDGSRGIRPIEVVWTPSPVTDRPDTASEQVGMEAEARERGLVAPLIGLHAADDHWHVRLRAAPLDPEFGQLARVSDPRYVREMLAPYVRATGLPTVTAIRYRPGERHVLRYDVPTADGTTTLFAKVYNGPKGERSFTTATRVAEWLHAETPDIGAARPLAFVEAERLVLYPRVFGTPLSERLRAPDAEMDAHLRHAGRTLAQLHRIPQGLIELQPHSFAREIKQVSSACEYIRVLLPDVGALIDRTLAGVEARHAALPEAEPSLAYGDFKADHLWLTPGRMTLIDFDTCYLADPAIDLGKFYADLHFWFDRYGLDGVAAAQERVLEGYGAVDADRLRRARLYEVLVLLKSTARRVKIFDADWAERTTRLTDRAAALLDAPLP